VWRSIEDPLQTHAVNAGGFVNVLLAARDGGVKRLVSASSSSVYGDDPTLPQSEDRVGRPLSPYAASKLANEACAAAFRRAYGFPAVGLRYFNVFGEGQDPEGGYATVIPRWVQALARGTTCGLFGDGSTSRDFCHVADVVQANLLAAVSDPPPPSDVYNVAAGRTTTLEALFGMLRERVAATVPEAGHAVPDYRPFRRGDLRHSKADLTRARGELGYAPTVDLAAGLDRTVAWFFAQAARADTGG
jgi:UDP-N-acetylglucosamine 4-epimerase